MVRQLALPAPAGDTTKCAISRAHRILKTWTWNRVRDVWHGDSRIRVSADELDQLRDLVRRKSRGERTDTTRGIMERVAAITGEVQELRELSLAYRRITSAARPLELAERYNNVGGGLGSPAPLSRTGV